MSDQIDVLSGLQPGSELYNIRRERMDFVEGTEQCRQTVLRPKHGFDLTHAMRAALAARMARLIGHEPLAAVYDDNLKDAGADALLLTIAATGDLPGHADHFIKAIVRHADLVTTTPRDSTRADIEKLETAGLDNPQIVALSELIAFVNYEARVLKGLEVLGDIA
jgi:uncharacterized protein YciW